MYAVTDIGISFVRSTEKGISIVRSDGYREFLCTQERILIGDFRGRRRRPGNLWDVFFR